MAQQNTIGKHKTKVFEDGEGFTCVKYHNTIVFKFKGNKVVLNSGGWKTSMTKTRINQALNEYGFPFHVFQKNSQWYVRDTITGYVLPYHDNITL